MKQKKPDIVKIQAKYEKSLYQAITGIETAAEAKSFFQDLCTPAETQAIVDRWCAAVMLEQGMTQREVAAKAGVSVTTVGRVARCLINKKSGYKRLLNQTIRINDDEKIK